MANHHLLRMMEELKNCGGSSLKNLGYGPVAGLTPCTLEVQELSPWQGAGGLGGQSLLKLMACYY